jgi:hypothetical protein
MLEKCARCGKDATPWEWRRELGGHVCYDCHLILNGIIDDDETNNSEKIE